MFAFEAVNPAWITQRKTFTSQRQQQETDQTHPTRGIEARGHIAGADPGLFLGKGALVSCSTSTPINHIVFFLQNTNVLENRRSS